MDAATAAPLDASSSDLEVSPRGSTINSTERKNEATGRQLSVAECVSDTSYLIKERLIQALRFFKESTDQHILVQVWAPVRKGNRCVLTTSDQPFVLNSQAIGLLQYRTVSLTYVFAVDGENTDDLGLPGRVFRNMYPGKWKNPGHHIVLYSSGGTQYQNVLKVLEWTPDVQSYSVKEYPRLSHAVNYKVCGTVALPVFEPSTQSCVAVLELITTSPEINLTSEVNKVCKALEVVL